MIKKWKLFLENKIEYKIEYDDIYNISNSIRDIFVHMEDLDIIDSYQFGHNVVGSSGIEFGYSYSHIKNRISWEDFVKNALEVINGNSKYLSTKLDELYLRVEIKLPTDKYNILETKGVELLDEVIKIYKTLSSMGHIVNINLNGNYGESYKPIILKVCIGDNI